MIDRWDKFQSERPMYYIDCNRLFLSSLGNPRCARLLWHGVRATNVSTKSKYFHAVQNELVCAWRCPLLALVMCVCFQHVWIELTSHQFSVRFIYIVKTCTKGKCHFTVLRQTYKRQLWVFFSYLGNSAHKFSASFHDYLTKLRTCFRPLIPPIDHLSSVESVRVLNF